MAKTRVIRLVVWVVVLAAGFAPAAERMDVAQFDQAAAMEQQAAQILLSSSRWDTEGLREMGRKIDELPDPVASRVLWMAACAPERSETMQFFSQAISSPSPSIRAQAADLLLANGTTGAMRLIFGRLVVESDPLAIEGIVGGMARLPVKQAVTNLMEIMLRANAKPETIRVAAEHLRRLTGAKIQDNPIAWRDWWLDHSGNYR